MDYNDVIVKHGADVPGDWHCLAILDSKPSDKINEDPKGNSNLGETLESMYDLLMPPILLVMGMDAKTYGITPIAIYRKLNVIEK